MFEKFIKDKSKTVVVLPIRVDGCAAEYQDARSATFYAMGMSIKEKQIVTLLMSGKFITNAYTAMIEAWFQKARIVIFAFYDKISEVNTSWADRCAKTLTIHIDEYEEKIQDIEVLYQNHCPILINVVGLSTDAVPIDYSHIISNISLIDNNCNFICYNGQSEEGVTNISSKHMYGVLSKYIGMSISSNVGYLLCNTECFLVDVNIFRTRYANENMKIVVLDDGRLAENGVDQWIVSNNWLCKRVNRMNANTAQWLVDQSMQSVLIIGGEE